MLIQASGALTPKVEENDPNLQSVGQKKGKKEFNKVQLRIKAAEEGTGADTDLSTRKMFTITIPNNGTAFKKPKPILRKANTVPKVSHEDDPKKTSQPPEKIPHPPVWPQKRSLVTIQKEANKAQKLQAENKQAKEDQPKKVAKELNQAKPELHERLVKKGNQVDDGNAEDLSKHLETNTKTLNWKVQDSFESMLSLFEMDIGALLSTYKSNNSLYLAQSNFLGNEDLRDRFKEIKDSDTENLGKIKSLNESYGQLFDQRIKALKNSILHLQIESEFLTQCLGNDSRYHGLSTLFWERGTKRVFGLNYRFSELEQTQKSQEYYLSKEEAYAKKLDQQKQQQSSQALKNEKPVENQANNIANEAPPKLEPSSSSPASANGEVVLNASEAAPPQPQGVEAQAQALPAAEPKARPEILDKLTAVLKQAKVVNSKIAEFKEVVTIHNAVVENFENKFSSKLPKEFIAKHILDHRKELLSFESASKEIAAHIASLDEVIKEMKAKDPNSPECASLIHQQLKITSRYNLILKREKEIKGLLQERRNLLKMQEAELLTHESTVLQPLGKEVDEGLELNKKIVSLKENTKLKNEWEKQVSLENRRKQMTSLEANVKGLETEKQTYVSNLASRQYQISQSISTHQLWIQTIDAKKNKIEDDLKLLTAREMERQSWRVESSLMDPSVPTASKEKSPEATAQAIVAAPAEAPAAPLAGAVVEASPASAEASSISAADSSSSSSSSS